MTMSENDEDENGASVDGGLESDDKKEVKTNEQQEDIDNYVNYNYIITLIQKLLAELILFQDWFASNSNKDDLDTYWSNSRLREQINDGRLQAGAVLSVACQRSFTILHTEPQITVPEQILLFSQGSDVYEIDQIFHETTIFVPIFIILYLLQDFPEAISYASPWTGRTALHEAVDSVSRSNGANNGSYVGPKSKANASASKVIRTLVNVYPKLVRVPDDYGALPVDLLARIVLMKEESFKYAARSRNGTVFEHHDQFDYLAIKEELTESWECARILVVAQCRQYNLLEIEGIQQIKKYGIEDLLVFGEESDDNTPILHACLTAEKVPLSLIEQAIRRFGDQLIQPNAQGNLPLHLVSSKRLQGAEIDGSWESEEDDVGETYFFLLNEILKRYPKAASIPNNEGFIPLDLAIAAGRRWETGISCLLNVYPKGLADNLSRRNIPFAHFSFILSSLVFMSSKTQSSTNINGENFCITVIYLLLRSNPDMI